MRCMEQIPILRSRTMRYFAIVIAICGVFGVLCVRGEDDDRDGWKLSEKAQEKTARVMIPRGEEDPIRFQQSFRATRHRELIPKDMFQRGDRASFRRAPYYHKMMLRRPGPRYSKTFNSSTQYYRKRMMMMMESKTGVTKSSMSMKMSKHRSSVMHKRKHMNHQGKGGMMYRAPTVSFSVPFGLEITLRKSAPRRRAPGLVRDLEHHLTRFYNRDLASRLPDFVRLRLDTTASTVLSDADSLTLRYRATVHM